MISRRSACIAAAVAALLACAPASASPPRIVNGSAASQGEYPAQGFLQLATNEGNYVCGGTLVSNRYFLTAAHCATQPNTTTPLAPGAFTVSLGKVNRSAFGAPDRYNVAQNQVHADYALVGPADDIPSNDVALLTLASPAPASLEPLRVVEAGETGLWANGDIATIVGWGSDENGAFPDALQEATVPMRSDAYCQGPGVWGTAFVSATMVCAGGGSTDTCGGDSGGPLMVSDGAFLILAGLTSWGANECGSPGVPGVYTRLGATALNDWVRARVPMARATVSDATVDPGDSVTLSVTANHPGVPGYFTTFNWDLDDDGAFDDAAGASVTHAYSAGGRFVARALAGGSGADTATDKVAVQVGPPAPEPTPEPTPQPTPQPTVGPSPQPAVGPQPAPPLSPPAAGPAVSEPQATILTTGRPQARRGRFTLRVRFAPTAPAGTAVIEVRRRGRTIGIARVRVVRGGTQRIRVQLTPTGRRLLRRSASKRLKTAVRVRVGRRVLRSKTVTIRR